MTTTTTADRFAFTLRARESVKVPGEGWQRTGAYAVAALVCLAYGREPGQCLMAGCEHAARDGAHALPARTGHAYLSHAVPTCKVHNDVAETMTGDILAGVLATIGAAIAHVETLSPADVAALADRRAAGIARRNPSAFIL